MAQVIFRKCLFFLSSRPYCWGVLTHDNSWIISSCWKICASMIIKVSCIMRSESLNSYSKFSLNHVEEIGNNMTHIWFVFCEKYPCYSSTIVNKGYEKSGSIHHYGLKEMVLSFYFCWLESRFSYALHIHRYHNEIDQQLNLINIAGNMAMNDEQPLNVAFMLPTEVDPCLIMQIIV